MTIAQTQQVTGTGSPLVLNGVAVGALLTMQECGFKTGATGAWSTPGDSAGGTWVNVIAPTCAGDTGGNGIGSAIAALLNVSAGTHSCTIDGSFTSRHCTLIEWSGAVASPIDKSNSGSTSGDHTNNTVGTTGTLSQADELVVAVCSLGASAGAADVGWTDPVSTYTTQQKFTNDATDVAGMHIYKIVNATTAEAPTFNWTSHEAVMGSQSVIATFMAVQTYAPRVPRPDIPFPQVVLDDMGLGAYGMLDVRTW